jgi:branched-subunit amino acid aminotransferase/4-amino-4-deoxychorismate lyase
VEVFLTQSTSGVSPVSSIDEIYIGDGTLGPKTLALRQKYRNFLKEHAEFF